MLLTHIGQQELLFSCPLIACLIYKHTYEHICLHFAYKHHRFDEQNKVHFYFVTIWHSNKINHSFVLFKCHFFVVCLLLLFVSFLYQVNLAHFRHFVFLWKQMIYLNKNKNNKQQFTHSEFISSSVILLCLYFYESYGFWGVCASWIVTIFWN